MVVKDKAFKLLILFSLFLPFEIACLANGWMWHGEFPWIYSHSSKSWIYLKAGPREELFRWDQSSSSWSKFEQDSNQWKSIESIPNEEPIWLEWESNPSAFGGIYTLAKIKAAFLSSSDSLDLSYSKISSLAPMAKLTNLRELNIEGNQVADLSPLVTLENLEQLNASSNLIQNISPLDQISTLTHITLNDNEIDDTIQTAFQQIGNLKNLKELNLARNNLNSVEGSSSFTQLEKLDLNGNSITNADPLGSLDSLKVLDLGNNQITPLPPFSTASKLMVLYMEDNNVSELLSLTNCVDLKEINFANNNINDLSPFNQIDFSFIWFADFSKNSLTSLDGIQNLTNLRILSISDNEVEDLSLLKPLGELRSLFMDNNKVVSLSPLGYNKNLLGLYATNNLIIDPYGLIGLDKLVEVLLWENNIDSEAKRILKLARPQTSFSFE